MQLLRTPPLLPPSLPTLEMDFLTLAQISKWTDPKRLLKLPPVAVVALHFVLVFLPVKLRKQDTGSSSPAAAAADTDGSKSFFESTMVASSEARGSGTAGQKRAAREKGPAGDVSGAGSVATGNTAVPAQLGEVPSHVFKALLPSDPAFEAEVLFYAR